jgi:hypothetical protein
MARAHWNSTGWIERHPRLAALIGMTGSAAFAGLQLYETTEFGTVRVLGRILAPAFFLFAFWIFLVPSALPKLPATAVTIEEEEAIRRDFVRKGCWGCLFALLGALAGGAWLANGLGWIG